MTKESFTTKTILLNQLAAPCGHVIIANVFWQRALTAPASGAMPSIGYRALVSKERTSWNTIVEVQTTLQNDTRAVYMP